MESELCELAGWLPARAGRTGTVKAYRRARAARYHDVCLGDRDGPRTLPRSGLDLAVDPARTIEAWVRRIDVTAEMPEAYEAVAGLAWTITVNGGNRIAIGARLPPPGGEERLGSAA